jgi:hypothetical protein
MPMVPSLLAAGVYTSVKLVGYAAFAHGLNRFSGRSVSPYKLAALKTALGLVAGLAYLYIVLSIVGEAREPSDIAVFAGAAPVRYLVWTIVLAIFYGFRDNPRFTLGVAILGVLWSYLLDGLMSLFYWLLPGMEMPLC